MPRAWLVTIALIAACVPKPEDKPRSFPSDPNHPNDPNDPNNPNDPNDPTNPIDDPNTPCEEKGPPVTPRLRRLTFAQYDRTASQLLGVEVTPSTELGPEVEGMNSVLWSGIETAAASLAEDARVRGFASLLPCTPAGDGSACARQFITEFGLLAYRRPLSDAEIDRYAALYTDRATLTATGTFDEGIALILEAFLQSPNFLLRVERSATVESQGILLSGYELGARLSFALWNAPPDRTLLDAAAAGELDSPEGVRAQALRMLTGDNASSARPLMRDAHREWLGMVGAYSQFWSNTLRDTATFPEFYPGIDIDFRDEVLRYTDRIVFDEDGSYRDLLTSKSAVVNAKIAPIYGLSGEFTDEWVPVTLDDTRPGLLTRAGFVGTHGRFSRGSLIFRGAFVLKRMLCTTIGSPPAGAESTPLPDATAELVTTRDRIVAMTSPPTCAGCHHELINPAGFGLEVFDGIGRYRTMDNGAPVDPSGEIFTDRTKKPYDGPAAYAEVLAASPQAAQCYVDRFAQFTFGDSSVELGCTTEALAANLSNPDTSIKEFLVEFVASDAFRYRSLEEAP